MYTHPPKSGFLARAFAPVDGASLAVFRMAFGAIMMWEVWRYFAYGWIRNYYVEPDFHFHYSGFTWVNPWPGDFPFLHFALVGILAGFVFFGKWYRATSLLFFLGFSQWFLLEKAHYLNHLYLVCLLALLMSVVPANRVWSLDALRRPEGAPRTIPAWALWLIRFQIAVPYFFGGVAKLNGDWLRGEPMRMWLSSETDFPVIGKYFTEEWMVMGMTYSGLLLDLFIVPALMWKRTRLLAYVTALLFHLMNARLFSIGIFPWFMMLGTTIFFAPDWPRRFVGGRRREAAPEATAHAPNRLVLGFVGVWVAIQVLMPFRHWLYPGNVNWTEEGHNFAWHMKLRDKASKAMFTATDPATGESWVVPYNQHLTLRQRRKMRRRPTMLLEFAHWLGAREQEKRGSVIELRAEVLASLNGRPRELLIDPEVDLMKVRDSIWPADWILPLTEPLPSRNPEQVSGATR